MPYAKGNLKQPEVLWRFVLPSYPPKGPESTPAFDDSGNIYFGAHDGCFYSLNPNGVLRWMLKTADKIYSSPAIHGQRVVFCSGDGHCFCFDLAGRMQWVYNAADYFTTIRNPIARKLALARTRWSTRDSVRRNTWATRCWTSPNISSRGVVYVTAYGLGLHALQIADGKPLWAYDLGQPRHHLSGVALNENEEIFVASQRNRLHSISTDGRCRWISNAPRGYDAWGNPSIDLEKQLVFFPLSRQEKQGLIMALDYEGHTKWVCEIPGGIRGSVAITRAGHLLAAGMSGNLYYIDSSNGRIVRDLHLSRSRHRGMWTTPSEDPDGHIYATTKDDEREGAVHCLNADGEIVWRCDIGKALSTPVLDQNNRIYAGSWHGELLCLQT